MHHCECAKAPSSICWVIYSMPLTDDPVSGVCSLCCEGGKLQIGEFHLTISRMARHSWCRPTRYSSQSRRREERLRAKFAFSSSAGNLTKTQHLGSSAAPRARCSAVRRSLTQRRMMHTVLSKHCRLHSVQCLCGRLPRAAAGLKMPRSLDVSSSANSGYR